MVNNKLDTMVSIIKNTFTYDWGKMYFYPNIPEKIFSKLMANFDIYLNTKIWLHSVIQP